MEFNDTAMKKIMKRIVLRRELGRFLPHEEKSEKSLVIYESFRSRWTVPRDFKETFQFLMNELEEKEAEILFLRYSNEDDVTFREVGEKTGLAVSAAQRYEREAIEKLSKSPYWDMLLYGRRRYQMAKTALKSSKNPEDVPSLTDMLLSGVHLSPAVYNILRRNGCETVGDVYKRDSLLAMAGCGEYNASEIVSVFNELGLDTTKWQEELNK